MEILGFQTVNSLPALYHPDLDLLVISDLHLGLEKTMTFRGNYIPQHQLQQVKEDIETAREESGASRILVNGDLKNEFRTSSAEEDEIEQLLEMMEEVFEDIIVVKGNHDTMVEEQKFSSEFVDCQLENRILFIHGDKVLDELEIGGEFDMIVIGHEHPALALEDEIGVREKIDCFLYGETRRKENIIVLPAFSDISNGTSVNETPQSQLLSPLLRNRVDIEDLMAVGVSRQAGIMEFTQLEKLRQ
ncbi:MAG: metallophosphoesterase [Candidatus Nanohaloarchaea archaeon]